MRLNVILNGKRIEDEAVKLLILDKSISAVYSSTFKYEGYTYKPASVFVKVPYAGDNFIDRNFVVLGYLSEEDGELSILLQFEVVSTMYIADMEGVLKKDYIELKAKISELPEHIRRMITYIYDIPNT